MNKKNYMTPNTEVIKLNVQSCLLDASITSVNMGEGLEDMEVGGSTDDADARGGYWDDED
jgi:hypothetical protein